MIEKNPSPTSNGSDLRSFWDSKSAIQLEDNKLPINFRSIRDLTSLLLKSLHHISGKFDYIVGVPRSGLLPATILALHLNMELLSLENLLRGQFVVNHSARGKLRRLRREQTGRCRVLIVDDSVNTGKAITSVKDMISRSDLGHVELEYLAVYASSNGLSHVDYHLERIDHPRIFEWNVMHHGYSTNFLCDLDGILCVDGPAEQSNDGGKYLSYIRDAPLKVRPLLPLGAIVTSRLSKYRGVTEDWLGRNEIRFKQLIMLELDSAERRRELAIHAKYKADVYKALGGHLFIESEDWQAREIARTVKKPVYLFDHALLLTG